MTAKAHVLEAVKKLPDNLSYEEIAKRLEVLAALQEGLDQADNGQVVSMEEVERRMKTWITK